ncbi:DUF2804 domain-containing protein [Haloimpatiens sp. FM7315]|uniref:DUF2804 domain-containing protein n=1 Tax=Haloimpatiens sp. FM7315 TaxID=3298609 RepID=UPI0035A3CA11
MKSVKCTNYNFKEQKLSINKDFNLCNEKSDLDINSVGWSRIPKHNCNIKNHWLRKKKFNYWNIYKEDFLFNITITNFDYIGLISIYILDIKRKTQIEKTIKVPFGIGCNLPNKVYDNIVVLRKDIKLTVENINNQSKINLYCENFNNSTLKANFAIDNNPKHETLNVVIPWSIKRFHFTSKQNCLPVSGKLIINNKIIDFKKGFSLASLDFGRGIFPYNTFWNWCSFSSKYKNQYIGINLGSGWTDGTGLTENAITINDKIIKIKEDVEFIYDKNNLMKKWHIKTINSNKIDLIFCPFIKKSLINNFIVIKSNFCQLYGYFSGKIINECKDEIDINHIFGTVEEHTAKW